MSAPVYRIVIVGAERGGAQAALSLRQQGFEGEIIMIGREIEPPYERAPPSKEHFAGNKSFERLYIRRQEFWEGRRVTLKLGVSVVRVDAQRKAVGLDNGEAITFDALIWATGGDARNLVCLTHASDQDLYRSYHDPDRERRAQDRSRGRRLYRT